MRMLNNTCYLFLSIFLCIKLGASASDAKKMAFFKSVQDKELKTSAQQQAADAKKKASDQKQTNSNTKEIAQIEAQLRSLFVEMFVTKYAIKNMGIYDWLVPKKFIIPNYDQLTKLEKLKYMNELSIKHNKLIDEIQKLSKKIPDKDRILQIKEEAIILGADQVENRHRYFEDKSLAFDAINDTKNNDDDSKD